MIAGMSGSLLSHDALDELWQRPDPAVVTFAAEKPHRHLRAWHAGIRARLGPTATARTVFDAVAEPLLRSLGFDISVVQSSSQICRRAPHDLGTPGGRADCGAVGSPAAEACGARPCDAGWRIQVRWTICVNGSAIAAFDVRRAYARRWVEFEMEVALDVEQEPWRAVHAARRPGARRKRRSARCSSGCSITPSGIVPPCGVLSGPGSTMPCCSWSRRSAQAVSRSHTDSQLLDESLIVVYRLLFLLFAEARNLVPTWHPIYRDSYTIDTIVRPLHNDRSPTGVWEAFQALSRLAHRGCRAGPMRVPPFNGRLFSPACAPLAARVVLERFGRAPGGAVAHVEGLGGRPAEPSPTPTSASSSSAPSTSTCSTSSSLPRTLRGRG